MSFRDLSIDEILKMIAGAFILSVLLGVCILAGHMSETVWKAENARRQQMEQTQ
ncbi:MAG: hypothetical protein KDA32_10890 [Phycisphaerales bacterium]|nr:hypothetical protein [Phycisphaerales bacterium]